MLSLLLRRRNVTKKAALKLLDDASAAIQYNRDLLQHALDHARQGITVFDKDLRLMCWNREFQDLFELPGELARAGIGLDEIVRFNAARGSYGPGEPDEFVAARLESFVNDVEPVRVRLHTSGQGHRDPLGPHAGRRHRHDLHRHHRRRWRRRRRWSAPTRRWSGASASAPRS